MRLAAACALPGGRSASRTVARSFHLVLAVTSQNLTAWNCGGTPGASVGRSAHPHVAAAIRSAQRTEHRVLDIMAPPSACESKGRLAGLPQTYQLARPSSVAARATSGRPRDPPSPES